jgi:hypothetical protein
VCVLTLVAGQAESLWDEALPVEVRELPEDLAALDRVLAEPGLLEPIVVRFCEEASPPVPSRSGVARGRGGCLASTPPASELP